MELNMKGKIKMKPEAKAIDVVARKNVSLQVNWITA